MVQAKNVRKDDRLVPAFDSAGWPMLCLASGFAGKYSAKPGYYKYKPGGNLDVRQVWAGHWHGTRV